MRRIKLVLSDLHLGFGRLTADGGINGMEDFTSDGALVDLLEYYRTGEYADAEVELVFNGDIFECLIPLAGDAEPDLITEAKSIAKFHQIVRGHRTVFEAMSVFVEEPHRQISFVVGNHDQDLQWASVRQFLRDEIGAEVRFFDESYEFDGIHLEHGHQHEHQNHVEHRSRFLTRGLVEPALNLPWGSDMFINILVPLKRERPYLNRVRPLRLAFEWTFWHDFRMLLRFLWHFVATLWRARFRAQAERRITLLQTLRVMFSGQAYPTLEGPARKLLAARQDIHTVIFGHTHLPMWRQLLPGKTYINSGSWMPTSNLHISALGSSLQQTYVYIEYHGAVPRGQLKLWHGRRVVEEDLVL